MMDIRFPENLYADIRIEEYYEVWLSKLNGEAFGDGDIKTIGAMIRIFDGTIWYTASVEDINQIQEELDNLAQLATPNPNIYEHEQIKCLEIHKEDCTHIPEEECAINIPRETLVEIIDHYEKTCGDITMEELTQWYVHVHCGYRKKSFLSSKGAHIVTDYQRCILNCGYTVTVDGVSRYTGYYEQAFFLDGIRNQEQEILKKRDRALDYSRNMVDIEPGEYACVLSPNATALFTHECFGHKSEADYMLNDKTLQDEWIMGKKVGSEKVSICDNGALLHNGYIPYDDEGTKARETWLIKDGILTGRLHNAKSAVALKEEMTGNSRAENYYCPPVVRMTNTYMKGGTDTLEEMLAGIEDGIYVYDVCSGTGSSTFTMTPLFCYRIRNGKVCEPVRVNVISGSVFQTLFDVDMVGNDMEIFDNYTCGKMGQTVDVSAGGPSIRLKKLHFS